MGQVTRRMGHLLTALSGSVVALLVYVIGLYRRLVSPLLGPRCRFVPSCSSYAIRSLHKYGVVKGLSRTTWRICRCHPLGRSGYDPP